MSEDSVSPPVSARSSLPGPASRVTLRAIWPCSVRVGRCTFNLTALEPQTGAQTIASDYSYQITSATGVFQGAEGGGGSVTLTLIQGPRSHFGYPRILQRFILSLKSDSLAT